MHILLEVPNFSGFKIALSDDLSFQLVKRCEQDEPITILISGELMQYPRRAMQGLIWRCLDVCRPWIDLIAVQFFLNGQACSSCSYEAMYCLQISTLPYRPSSGSKSNRFNSQCRDPEGKQFQICSLKLHTPLMNLETPLCEPSAYRWLHFQSRCRSLHCISWI